MMFDFLFMSPYEGRKIGRWDSSDGKRMVSTCSVNDGDHPYETAFKHPDYNGGDMVIVEAYDTKEDAQSGHERWVKVMTKGPLPAELSDCNNAQVAQMASAFGAKHVYPRKKSAVRKKAATR